MQTMNRILASAALMFFLSACGNNNEHASHEAHEQEKPAADTVQASAAQAKLKDESVNAIYQHYAHLTAALVNEDAAEARIAAQAIETGANDVSGAGNIAASAKKIASTNKVEEQRTVFATLSDDMIQLVKKSGVSQGEVYVDYCPMAFNNKGAHWLSTKKEINNPYYGDEMLRCGEIKEAIR